MARRRSYRKSVRRGSKRVGGTTKKVLIGLGAAGAGGIIANMLGVNRMIPAAAIGYFGAGGIGLITALASDMLTGQGGLGSIFGLRQSSSVGGTVYS